MTDHDYETQLRAFLVTGGGYFDPDTIAAEIADGTFQVPTDNTDVLADRLTCWVAAVAQVCLEENTDNPVKLIADLVATAMIIQHRADLRAALGITEAEGAPAFLCKHPLDHAVLRKFDAPDMDHLEDNRAGGTGNPKETTAMPKFYVNLERDTHERGQIVIEAVDEAAARAIAEEMTEEGIFDSDYPRDDRPVVEWGEQDALARVTAIYEVKPAPAELAT